MSVALQACLYVLFTSLFVCLCLQSCPRFCLSHFLHLCVEHSLSICLYVSLVVRQTCREACGDTDWHTDRFSKRLADIQNDLLSDLHLYGQICRETSGHINKLADRHTDRLFVRLLHVYIHTSLYTDKHIYG